MDLARPDRAADAELVVLARSGDQRAFGHLYDTWFGRTHDLAYRIVRDRHIAADVAQEAFLSAWRHLGDLQEPAAFGGWLLRITRNAALNRTQLSEVKRSNPTDAETLLAMEAAAAGRASQAEDRFSAYDDPEKAAQDAEIASLVWDAAEALGERDASVLDMHLRHGLTPGEIAETIGVNRNAANQLLHRLRARLGVAIGARVLWRGGHPSCAALRAALTAASITSFSEGAVRVIGAHTTACDDCQRAQRLRLEPSVLFGALPVLAAPIVARQQVADALAAAGVPVAASHGGGGDGAVYFGFGLGRDDDPDGQEEHEEHGQYGDIEALGEETWEEFGSASHDDDPLGGDPLGEDAGHALEDEDTFYGAPHADHADSGGWDDADTWDDGDSTQAFELADPS